MMHHAIRALSASYTAATATTSARISTQAIPLSATVAGDTQRHPLCPNLQPVPTSSRIRISISMSTIRSRISTNIMSMSISTISLGVSIGVGIIGISSSSIDTISISSIASSSINSSSITTAARAPRASSGASLKFIQAPTHRNRTPRASTGHPTTVNSIICYRDVVCPQDFDSSPNS